jgi:hypothetical protein
MKLGTGSKYKNMEVAESAAGLLIYKELDYSCIHGGKNGFLKYIVFRHLLSTVIL